MKSTNPALQQAYWHCQQLARTHYENFPVASFLLPKRLRLPICAIYAFARSADDFADEGMLSTAERLQKLDAYNTQLDAIAHCDYQGNDPVFIALADAIKQFQLPINLLRDLLTAFRQDVVKTRYQTFAEVLDYCRYSANPVGRLLLHLNGQPDLQQLQQSDAICTALQLINFYQDIRQDYQQQNRIYIPLTMLAAAGIDRAGLTASDTRKVAPVLRQLYQQTQHILQTGVDLGNHLSGRLGWEIRAMTLGGIIILKKLINQPDEQLFSRPRLSRFEHVMVLARSLSKSTLSPHMAELTDSGND